MKIVTVTITGTETIPLVFKSTDFVRCETSLDTDLWKDCLPEVGVNMRMSVINLMFVATIINKYGIPTQYLVNGNIEEFGEVLENGGTLKNTTAEFRRVWERSYNEQNN